MPANRPDSTRRGFLRTSSLAALAGGAGVSGLNLLQAAHTGVDDTIRIGLIGCGGRGSGAAAQAMNTSGSTKLVAMADVFADNLTRKLEGLRRQYGDKVDVPPERQFVGFDAFRHLIEQDIDLVVIATPPGFRPLHFEYAIAAGKHVFAEKPVGVDAPGIRRFLVAAEESKRKNLLVQIGLQRRHERAYMETIDRLQNGAIGNIVAARAYWNGTTPWVRLRKPNYTEMQYQMRNWYYFNWLCGDHIVEQHIHNLDVINWLMDDHPVKAQGQGGRQVRTGKEHGEIYDHHFVEFTYGENGLGNNVVMLSQCRHMRNCWNEVNEYAHGSDGFCNIGRAEIYDAKGALIWEYGDGGRDGHQQEHHDLFGDLRVGKRPNEAVYGAQSTMTSILGRLATYSGQEVTWDAAINSEISLGSVDDYHGFDDTPPVLPNEDLMYPVAVPGITKVL